MCAERAHEERLGLLVSVLDPGLENLGAVQCVVLTVSWVLFRSFYTHLGWDIGGTRVRGWTRAP